MLCCGIKPMCGWNCERAGSVCRERCGGQGYLSCNRFGHIIGFAHAAVTAEGDNRVLMQKTAKELLSMAAADAPTQARLKAALSSSRQVRCRPRPAAAAAMPCRPTPAGNAQHAGAALCLHFPVVLARPSVHGHEWTCSLSPSAGVSVVDAQLPAPS